MIDKLTPEQEDLIPVYWEKWRAIALSTEPIDRDRAADAVKKAYTFIREKEPDIIFIYSPYMALNKVLPLKSELGSAKDRKLHLLIWEELENELCNELDDELWSERESTREGQPESLMWNRIWDELETQFDIVFSSSSNLGCLEPELWVHDGYYFDICISILNCTHYTQEEWSLFQALVSNCGWIFAFDKVCYVCDRPRILSFDSQQRLHAEGSPAIQFADGFSVYAYHGVSLPEKYGKVHPQQWRSEWLLSEDNAELRRVLIQGIGYDRICQELAAVELDSWQEYTLLKIDNNVDVEAIYLLKMTCPSTGYVHILRVPPDVSSAREAICWVNWGIDPEEFAVQS